jgi:hypothetical protein
VLHAPPGVAGRLSVLDGKRVLRERFVSTPCAEEVRRFGVDRAAMTALAVKAGGNSRVIESPRDLAEWAAEKQRTRAGLELRPWLIALALALLLAHYAARER